VNTASASNSRQSVLASLLNEEGILHTEDMPTPDVYQLLKINKQSNMLTQLTVLWQTASQNVAPIVILSRTQPCWDGLGNG
jgi:hypothetical protein